MTRCIHHVVVVPKAAESASIPRGNLLAYEPVPPLCGRTVIAIRSPIQILFQMSATEIPLAKKLCSDKSTTTDVTLCLRTTRKAKSGSGLFETFVPAKSDRKRDANKNKYHDPAKSCDTFNEDLTLPREPLSSATKLLQRWISLIETISQGFDTRVVLGDWMELIPPRIENSNEVSSALECFLNSTVAYVNPTAENITPTDKSNVKALYSIRTAIIDRNAQLLNDDVLLAITLLHFVEVYITISSTIYRLIIWTVIC